VTGVQTCALPILADAGIDSIRVGTKELAFYPDRFDITFFNMLDDWHTAYPEVQLRMMVHFNHPDEFLQKDENRNYIVSFTVIAQNDESQNFTIGI